MKEILIVSGKRTPMGEYGGALRDRSALELGAIASKAAIEQLQASLKKSVSRRKTAGSEVA